MKPRYFLLAALVLLLTTACGDYLDRTPSRTSKTPLQDAEQLLALYDSYSTFVYSTNDFAFYCTDEAELPAEMVKAQPQKFTVNNLSCYCLYREGILDLDDSFWQGEYKKIYTCNLIINNAGRVSGSQAIIDEAVACAHYARAYSYFDLLSYYCLPWSEANKDSYGLPLRLNTDYEESLSRATLEKTYDLVLSDLEEADKLTVRQAPDPEGAWRVSKCAINALYARIYLQRGEYDKALDYSTKALADAPALLDYNTLGTTVKGDVTYPETYSWKTQQNLYFQEWIFPRFIKDNSNWAHIAPSLEALYDHENDLRYKLFCLQNWSKEMGVDVAGNNWWQFNAGSMCTMLLSGLTPQEMMLIKAECQARQGQGAAAIATLAPLRQARYRTGTAPTPNTSDALAEVLRERQRELTFASRLADIKRFAVNDTPADDVTITRQFFEMTPTGVDTDKPKTWTIAGGSNALAIPIFQQEINASNGAIEQNPE